MLSKYQILQKIIDVGVVAAIRAENTEQAEKIISSCLDGGLNAVEITYTIPNASQLIEKIIHKFSNFDLVVGAGTILDVETARIASLAGAKFIVGPNFSQEICKLTNRYQLPYLPGCMTINEAISAIEAGVDIVKIFPGGVFGPDFIKSIKAPLPQIMVMPMGGVTLDNISKWIKAGSVAVGIGGEFLEYAKNNNYAAITSLVKQAIAAVKTARS